MLGIRDKTFALAVDNTLLDPLLVWLDEREAAKLEALAGLLMGSPANGS